MMSGGGGFEEDVKPPILPPVTQVRYYDEYSDEDEDDDGFSYSGGGVSHAAISQNIKQAPVAAVAANVGSTSSNSPGTTTKTALGTNISPKSTLITKRAIPKIPFVTVIDAINFGKTLQTYWRVRNLEPDCIQGIHKLLAKAFDECPNPYALALNSCVYANAFDFFHYKTQSLSYQVLNGFQKWLQLQQDGFSKIKMKHLTRELQLISFEIATAQKNITFAKLIFEIYCLDEIKPVVLQRTHVLCHEKEYREAYTLARILGLHAEFSIHDFLVPLLLKDHVQMVEEYLDESKEKQIEFLTYLDNLVGSDSAVNAISDYIGENKITNVNHEKWSSVKPLTKMINRLSQKFRIACPHTVNQNKVGYLRHIMYLRYEDCAGKMNDDCFEEMVDAAVLDDPTLWDKALYQMRTNGDTLSAAKFALRKCIPLEKISSDIQRIMKELDPNLVLEEPPEPEVIVEEDWDTGEVRIIKKSGMAVADTASCTSPNLNCAVITTKPDEPVIKSKSSILHINNANSSSSLSQPQPLVSLIVHYKLPIPADNIQILDNAEGVDSFLLNLKGALLTHNSHMFDNDKFVTGFDAEWKPPSNPIIDKGCVALVQVAVGDEVFLIDTYVMRSITDKNKQRWAELLNEFFGNEQVVKLAFSISGDLKMLSITCPEWMTMKSKFKAVLDLQSVSNTLQKGCPTFFPYCNTSEEEGVPDITSLTSLVKACFGFGLDKNERFSNWERRPLRNAQVLYAAADAFVLLDVYNYMKQRAYDLDINFDLICNRILKSYANNSSAPGPAAAKKRK